MENNDVYYDLNDYLQKKEGHWTKYDMKLDNFKKNKSFQ